MGETRVVGQWWHTLPDGRIQCDLCPRDCRLHEGQRGACFVRMMDQGEMILTTWGLTSGLFVDPVEKKPLNHFYPGTSVLSFGTAGCNLTCKNCQNWEMTKSRNTEQLSKKADPSEIARLAKKSHCKSVAFTYNDPVIFAEFAIDTAIACREAGLKSIAVTAGYIHPEPARAFFPFIDAANVDLKGFSEDFYYKITGGHLAPVLDLLCYVSQETNVWLEVATLLIPGLNDSEKEISELSRWIARNLGLDVPLHFSAFHPDFKMLDLPPTPKRTLSMARRIAMDEGLHFVYTGNVHDPEGGTTFCPACHSPVIVRDRFVIVSSNLDENSQCGSCHHKIQGFMSSLSTNPSM